MSYRSARRIESGASSATPADPSAPAIAGSEATTNTTQGISARRSLTRPAAPSTMRSTVPLLSRNREQVGDTGEQHEQIDREPAVHVLRRLAHEDGADEERHHQRQGAEVDRPRGADEEDEGQAEDSDDVDGQGGRYSLTH